MPDRSAQWPIWAGVIAGVAVALGVTFWITSLLEEERAPAATAPSAPGQAPEAAPEPRARMPQQERELRPNVAARPAMPPPVAAPPPPEVPAPEVAPPADPAVTAAQEAQAVALQAQVRSAVAAEFEKARPTIVERCFAGQPRGTSDGAPSTGITYSVVVDDAGREIARGTNEGRDATPPEVRACLRENAPPPVQIAPPGRTVSVDVFVSYP